MDKKKSIDGPEKRSISLPLPPLSKIDICSLFEPSYLAWNLKEETSSFSLSSLLRRRFSEMEKKKTAVPREMSFSSSSCSCSLPHSLNESDFLYQ
ncbi:hypothetical protein CEXT_518491 [Caerostris extrusa]|uniref:Uncharacterized protein n=1 Tax=Caerostris extrusa TaxID=172846 RepID=A0AAV4TXQ1_CAEEX|nr:hypothetical protein CEXT_518491 [Caerostris extrusa]